MPKQKDIEAGFVLGMMDQISEENSARRLANRIVERYMQSEDMQVTFYDTRLRTLRDIIVEVLTEARPRTVQRGT